MPPRATKNAPPVTVDKARPLSDDEKATLQGLQARAALTESETPATRFGQPYIALINLSVPRRGDKDKQTDLVMPGEKVYLTADEAAQFNRKGRLDGRQIDVVVPEGSEAAEQFGFVGRRVSPRAVSGLVRTPPPAQPGQDPSLPRPDPAGSSHIAVYDVVPEAAEPQPGSEGDDGGTVTDAIDGKINPEMVGLR